MDLCQQSNISAFNTLSIFDISLFSFQGVSVFQFHGCSHSPVILKPKGGGGGIIVTGSTFSPSICLDVMGPDAVTLAF